MKALALSLSPDLTYKLVWSLSKNGLVTVDTDAELIEDDQTCCCSHQQCKYCYNTETHAPTAVQGGVILSLEDVDVEGTFEQAGNGEPIITDHFNPGWNAVYCAGGTFYPSTPVIARRFSSVHAERSGGINFSIIFELESYAGNNCCFRPPANSIFINAFKDQFIDEWYLEFRVYTGNVVTETVNYEWSEWSGGPTSYTRVSTQYLSFSSDGMSREECMSFLQTQDLSTICVDPTTLFVNYDVEHICGGDPHCGVLSGDCYPVFPGVFGSWPHDLPEIFLGRWVFPCVDSPVQRLADKVTFFDSYSQGNLGWEWF